MKEEIINKVKIIYDKMLKTKNAELIGIIIHTKGSYIHIPYCDYIDDIPYIRVIYYNNSELTGWYSYEQFESMINKLEVIKVEGI